DISQATAMGWMAQAEKEGLTFKRGMSFSQYVQDINAKFQKELPKGHELVFKKTLNKVTNEVERLDPYVVEASTNLSGDLLQDATVRIDQEQNRPYVGITFK